MAAYRSGYTPERHKELLRAGNALSAIEQALRVRRMTPSERKARREGMRDFDTQMHVESIRVRLGVGQSNRGRRAAATIFGNAATGGLD